MNDWMLNRRARAHTVAALALIVAASACEPFREGLEGHRDVVARVDGYGLSVERAARLLADAPEQVVPASPEVVDPFVDHWVHHILIANAYAQPDSFESIDTDPLTRLSLDQGIVWQLHQEVILSRAEPSEQELRQAFERERPWVRVRASHILIQVDESADRARRDSLRAFADDLRARILAGADFAELARRHSDDPATASAGGDLGWLERDRTVPELESALFDLAPDSVSVVPSRLGFHVVRVTERASPEFERVRDRYRSELVDRRTQDAEDTYLDSLFDAARLRFKPGAIPTVRQLARSARLERLPSAERAVELVRFEGGALTAGDLADFIMRAGPEGRRSFAGADSAQIHTLLRELVRNELLVSAARRHGYTSDPATVDSITRRTLANIRLAAIRSGYDRARLVDGASALLTAVDSSIARILRQDLSPIPIERLAVSLRRGHTIQVYPERFPEVARRVAEIRRERSETAAAGPGPNARAASTARAGRSDRPGRSR